MKIKDMLAFVFSHKTIRNAVICCLFCCGCLLAQLFLMDKSAIIIVFDVIIPFTAAITFGCYAITMAMDRPVILICPPTVYFVSLLIKQLIEVEVGVQDTYPFIPLLEMVPYAFFCICVATGKLKKPTVVMLKLFIAGTVAASCILAVLAVFFRIIIFSNRAHYLLDTFAMVCGISAVMFIYAAMIELLKIAGCEKRETQCNAAGSV